MKKIIIALLSILIFIAIGGYAYLNSTVKNYTQEITLPALSNKAEVVFDDFGIPHIYADNNPDAFQALGYVHASDRLFQMELLRRVGGGNLSELLGEKLIPTDKYIRTLGINENALRFAEAFEADTNEAFKQNVEAYISGINAYLKKGKTPIEFTILGIEKKPFTVVDIYRVLGYMGFGFSMELKAEPLFDWVQKNYGDDYLQDLSPGLNSNDVFIPVQEEKTDTADLTFISQIINDALNELPVPLFYGSNSWVINGSKTKSGKVLFANDTHIGFAAPSVWYEAHIFTPTLELYGNFAAGVPYPLIGHNKHHSWGLTIFPLDQMDLFSETLKDNKVMYKNKWVPLTTREEIIEVKNASPVNFTVSTTPHGPIISNLAAFSKDITSPVSVWWVANKVMDKKLQAIALLSESASFSDCKNAAKLIDSPGLNIMYGDIEGNVAWFGAGKIIKRPAHVNSKVILNGATGKDDPLGFYDFTYNPKNQNPDQGYVVSANNKPDSVNGEFYPGYYYAGARYKAISERIEKKNDWDIEAMQKLVMDDTSPIYPANCKVLASMISPNTEQEKVVLQTLTSWEGKHSKEQIAPTIYYKLIYHILHASMADEMGDDRFTVFLSTPIYLRAISPLINNDTSRWWNNITTKEKETRAEIIQLAFNITVKELTTQFGKDVSTWNWEKAHFIEHPHPLGKQKPLDKVFNVGPYPAGGGEEVINKIAFSLNAEGRYIARSGPAMRILLDFSDIENSLSINPTGISGNVMNPHYNDQAKMYVNGSFRKQRMNKSDIINSSIGKWIFVRN